MIENDTPEEQLKKLKEIQEDITKEWLKALFQILIWENHANDNPLSELTFWKTRIITEDDSVYALNLVHVSGPKIKLPRPSDNKEGDNNE